MFNAVSATVISITTCLGLCFSTAEVVVHIHRIYYCLFGKKKQNVHILCELDFENFFSSLPTFGLFSQYLPYLQLKRYAEQDIAFRNARSYECVWEQIKNS